MRYVFAALALFCTAPAFAGTYSWEDGGGVHFTDNLSSVPKKYRAKAAATASGDITRSTPEMSRSLQSGNRQYAADSSPLLSKSECSGIPGECGPGRSCVYQTNALTGKIVGKGYCTSESAANRDVMQANQMEKIERRLALPSQDLQDVRDKVDRINRKLGGY